MRCKKCRSNIDKTPGSLGICPLCESKKLFEKYGGVNWSVVDEIVSAHMLAHNTKLSTDAFTNVSRDMLDEYMGSIGMQFPFRPMVGIGDHYMLAQFCFLELAAVSIALDRANHFSPCENNEFDEVERKAWSSTTGFLRRAVPESKEHCAADARTYVKIYSGMVSKYENSGRPRKLNTAVGKKVLDMVVLAPDLSAAAMLAGPARRKRGPLAYPRTIGNVFLDSVKWLTVCMARGSS